MMCVSERMRKKRLTSAEKELLEAGGDGLVGL